MGWNKIRLYISGFCLVGLPNVGNRFSLCMICSLYEISNVFLDYRLIFPTYTVFHTFMIVCRFHWLQSVFSLQFSMMLYLDALHHSASPSWQEVAGNLLHVACDALVNSSPEWTRAFASGAKPTQSQPLAQSSGLPPLCDGNFKLTIHWLLHSDSV